MKGEDWRAYRRRRGGGRRGNRRRDSHAGIAAGRDGNQRVHAIAFRRQRLDDRGHRRAVWGPDVQEVVTAVPAQRVGASDEAEGGLPGLLDRTHARCGVGERTGRTDMHERTAQQEGRGRVRREHHRHLCRQRIPRGPQGDRVGLEACTQERRDVEILVAGVPHRRITAPRLRERVGSRGFDRAEPWQRGRARATADAGHSLLGERWHGRSNGKENRTGVAAAPAHESIIGH